MADHPREEGEANDDRESCKPRLHVFGAPKAKRKMASKSSARSCAQTRPMGPNLASKMLLVMPVSVGPTM